MLIAPHVNLLHIHVSTYPKYFVVLQIDCKKIKWLQKIVGGGSKPLRHPLNRLYYYIHSAVVARIFLVWQNQISVVWDWGFINWMTDLHKTEPSPDSLFLQNLTIAFFWKGFLSLTAMSQLRSFFTRYTKKSYVSFVRGCIYTFFLTFVFFLLHNAQ